MEYRNTPIEAKRLSNLLELIQTARAIRVHDDVQLIPVKASTAEVERRPDNEVVFLKGDLAGIPYSFILDEESLSTAHIVTQANDSPKVWLDLEDVEGDKISVILEL